VPIGRLFLVPIGETEARFLRVLGERVVPGLPLRGPDLVDRIDPAGFYDPRRNQYHSTPLLEVLSALPSVEGGDRVLGIATGDLFIPILTFVFGEAELGGRAAVFSIARLDPAFYGLPRSPDLLLERAVKEARHELGHTFGLIHCRHPDCVMRASTDAGEVDMKSEDFCRDCGRIEPLTGG